MEPVIIVLIILVVLVFIALIKTIQVIPQASAAIVERFGRYTRTLNAGLNIVVPFIDTIRNRIDLREQVVPFPPQPVITRAMPSAAAPISHHSHASMSTRSW